ncbi:hypothetical protein FMLHJGGC_00061 [Staphylococcus phage BSwM-KMM1]|nr:hypothetical protein FMLHJGGC_00061 [Pseudomonas phage BSwM KMM1]
MIEIRLVEDYDKSQLKFMLKKIKRVAPRELTYAMEAEMNTVDVNIEDVLPVYHLMSMKDIQGYLKKIYG